MPLIVEFVVISHAEPLQIVIAPCAVVLSVGHQINIILAAVALPSDAGTDRWYGAGIFGHGGARKYRIWERIGDTRPPIPRRRVGTDNEAQLQEPILGNRQRRLYARIGIVVES